MTTIIEMLHEVIGLYSSRNLKAAEALCRKILSIDPYNADAMHFLGIMAYEVGNLIPARELVQAAIDRMPDNASCYLNMGNIIQQQGDVLEAIQWYHKAIDRDPQYQKAYNNLGVAFKKTGRFQEAVKVLEKAIALDPQYIDAHNNLGEVYRHLGQLNRALTCCEKALDIAPDFVPARWNRAILHLITGDFEKGWVEYEWRWKRPSTLVRKIDAGVPWEGQALEGKTIFVYEEQGLGDTIQFMRYLTLLKQMGGRVIFEVLTPMIRLISSFQGFDRLWVGIRNVDTRPVDRFDFHVPLLSLPRLFKTSLQTIPDQVPYLKVEPSLTRIWGNRLKDVPGFKIGIVWAGNPGHNNDINRSARLSAFKGLSQIKDVSLFSLQMEKYDHWTDLDVKEVCVQDLGDQISDVAETAAIMENLDLIISVDTAVAHLAGAMGKKIWTLLPFCPDWRWMMDRNDSPWYPTMTLFRQPRPGDWDSVFKAVEKKITEQLR